MIKMDKITEKSLLSETADSLLLALKNISKIDDDKFDLVLGHLIVANMALATIRINTYVEEHCEEKKALPTTFYDDH